MYTSFQLAFKYLKYYFTASNSKGHGTHSPFVFEFITKVLNDKNSYPAYELVENLRKGLLADQTAIEVEDFGAGSGIDRSNKRKIASIAKNAAKPQKYGQLLYRMVKHYKSSVILELGTSLGITTSYLSLANPAAKVITMEGSASIASIAKQNFKTLKLGNTALIEGNFDETLMPLLNSISSIDLVFLDGNHRLQPTLNYFNQVLPKINNDTIVILDDIHWSAEMEEAWKQCREHESVTLSIDLFFIGILIFRKEIKEKQHFLIRF